MVGINWQYDHYYGFWNIMVRISWMERLECTVGIGGLVQSIIRCVVSVGDIYNAGVLSKADGSGLNDCIIRM